jgi:putative transposase
MATDGRSVRVACRVPGVSESGYYAWRKRPLSARAVRHARLSDRIRAVHAASRGTYGARRVQAELVLGRGISVGHRAVERLMPSAGIRGHSDRPRSRKSAPHAAAADRVGRRSAREEPDRLWVTDITEHPTREGTVDCAAVLDACSRRVVGRSIDAAPTAAPVTNAPGMAVDARRPAGPTTIHSDGTQYGSWAFTRRARDAGLLPSMGAVGTRFDNAVMESFWSRVQVELPDRRAWSTRLEPATARFEYLGLFHNRQRRRSSLGMLTPIEFEARQGAAATSTVA